MSATYECPRGHAYVAPTGSNLPCPVCEEALEAAVRDLEGLIEIGSADEVIGYIREGRTEAALEVIDQNARLQEACTNRRRADSLDALARRVVREAR